MIAKAGNASFVQFASLEEIDVFVTDKIDVTLSGALAEAGIEE